LDKYGLTEKDITLIHMDYADHVTAFVAGQADFISTGTAFWPQILTKSQEVKIIFKGPDLAAAPGKIMKDRMFESTAVKKDFADKNPDAVTKYVDVLFNRTHAYFNDAATKAKAHQELLDWLKLNVNYNQPIKDLSDLLNQVKYFSCAEQVKFFQDGTFKASEEGQIKYLVDTARIKAAFPYDAWANSKFVEAAAKK
jgi:ABC-type taurine transport system substrate-binding protein